MDLWNIKDLEPPPVLCCQITAKEIDIRLLDGVVKKAIEFFENQQHLHSEAALLSRMRYRLKTKFRNSKDFKALEKLCRVLRTYLQLQVARLLRYLSRFIPLDYRINETHLLTKNLMDYVLVRIQGLGKTLCRMLETCKIVSSLMQQRLRLGHFWKIAIVAFASSSRIFVITKSILKYICELYSNLLPFSSNLNNAGVRWLPADYSFPNRLDEWLNIDWVDLENVIEIEDDDPVFSHFNLADSDDDVEFCDEYILVNDETMISDSVFNDIIKIDPDSSNETDEVEVGEEVNESGEKTEHTNLADNLLYKNNDTDVGEVINISDVMDQSEVIDISSEPRKRKKKRKKKANVNNMNEVDVQNQSKKKRKKGAKRGPDGELKSNNNLQNAKKQKKNKKLQQKNIGVLLTGRTDRSKIKRKRRNLKEVVPVDM